MERFFEFAANHWDLFLALTIILLLMFGGPLWRRMKGYRNIEASDAVKAMNHKDAVVVDVRENNEFREGHIVGAIHIPLGSLNTRIGELKQYQGRPLVVACRSGNRSSHACGRLTKEGFQEVYNLKGGMMAWESAGLPVTRGDEKDRKKKKKQAAAR